jgi:hypothetical protein
VGKCLLTVQFALDAFAGPTAVERFDSKPFLEDLRRDLLLSNDWSGTVEGEVSRTFTGHNFERYRVEEKGYEYFVRDNDTQVLMFGPTRSASYADEACSFFNQRYEDGKPT